MIIAEPKTTRRHREWVSTICGVTVSKAESAVYYGSSKRKPDQQASQSMKGRKLGPAR